MTMDAAHWERVQALFHAATALPLEARRAYLEGECAGDAALLADVTGMLDEDAQSGSLLDRGVAPLADRMLRRSTASTFVDARFGPYRIRQLLGEGGMGVVYLAEREDLGSVAALKILRDAWLSPSRRERFASEQKTLAQLRHPAIAQLFDAGTLPDGTPWFVMEYVEGMPLTEYCRAQHAPVAERLRLLRAVCEAVQHAHRHAVIHRDLKPSNILVRPDGAVKLLDFGIAKQLAGLDANVDRTQTGVRLMTPAYAAPEQFTGARVGTYSDIYALGVVLYELLAGQLPFDLAGRVSTEAVALVLEHVPERPSVLARGTQAHRGADESIGRGGWADLDVLCLTAMHRDPQRRYATVDALVRDIDHYLSGEPLEARPDTLGYRLGKFVRRRRGQVAAAVAAFALIVALVVFYTVRLAGARNAALAQAARTERIQQFMQQLFEGGDESVGPADTLRVVTLLDRGVQQARSLDGEPLVQAELFETLGGLYQKTGHLERADSLLRLALEQRRALLGPEHPDVAASLVALGMLRNAQARYDSAERLVRAGLEMDRRTLGAGSAAVAQATASLGQVLEDRGVYDRAIPVLREAVRLHSQRGAAIPELRPSLTELANSEFYAGHYAASDSINRHVLAMDRAYYGEHHPNVADDLINLGANQYEWGRYADAERYDRQALIITQAYYGKNHPETASAYVMLARALVSQNKDDAAVSMLTEALGIQERVFGPVHPHVASTLNELGRVAQHQGKLDEAQADFQRMADIYKQVYHDKHYVIGIALSNLAGVYQARKDYARAEALFREVLRRYAQVLAPDHQLVGIAHVRLGQTLVQEARWPDAEQESRIGYGILIGQVDPASRWVQAARTDLVKEYGALNQPDRAARFRAELTRNSGK